MREPHVHRRIHHPTPFQKTITLPGGEDTFTRSEVSFPTSREGDSSDKDRAADVPNMTVGNFQKGDRNFGLSGAQSEAPPSSYRGLRNSDKRTSLPAFRQVKILFRGESALAERKIFMRERRIRKFPKGSSDGDTRDRVTFTFLPCRQYHSIYSPIPFQGCGDILYRPTVVNPR